MASLMDNCSQSNRNSAWKALTRSLAMGWRLNDRMRPPLHRFGHPRIYKGCELPFADKTCPKWSQSMGRSVRFGKGARADPLPREKGCPHPPGLRLPAGTRLLLYSSRRPVELRFPFSRLNSSADLSPSPAKLCATCFQNRSHLGMKSQLQDSSAIPREIFAIYAVAVLAAREHFLLVFLVCLQGAYACSYVHTPTLLRARELSWARLRCRSGLTCGHR
ncbi:hypothetical protein FKP32DRAFT_880173 [Trametes sanguinea]|nr:hypothetical protein FKP32DRAFT_880173 [Trametes sanguinea]